MPSSNGTDFVATIHHDTYPAISPDKHSSLTGKYVFISGASKGIGRATALSFARAGASAIGLGARSSLSNLESEILAAARDAKPNNSPPKVHTFKFDVLDNANIEKVAEQVKTEFGGRLDILVNNAGYLEDFKPIAESDPDEWWYTWTINMRGPYLVTRAFLPLLLEGGEKTIVNVSSIGAHATRLGASSYQTSKFALLRFTEFTMAEYGEQGMLAFAIHPGGVMTELAGKMPKHAHGLLTDKPELAGDTVTFLTKEKREWLAGRYIDVTWDMPEFLAKKDEIVQGDLLKVRMAV
ncbi:hypothetical protein MMC08_005670 [Hypocenomyce scalaris]|nr:hypothetical protein [Hypocenomyce scalaris]